MFLFCFLSGILFSLPVHVIFTIPKRKFKVSKQFGNVLKLLKITKSGLGRCRSLFMWKIIKDLLFRGLVPLHNACSYGHYEVTELLVKHGASVNVADLWKFTPLHEAAAKGKYEIVKLLLKVHTTFFLFFYYV